MLIRENLLDNSSERRVVKAMEQYTFAAWLLPLKIVKNVISISFDSMVVDMPPDNEIRFLIGTATTNGTLLTIIQEKIIKLEPHTKVHNIIIPKIENAENLKINIYACNPSKFIANKGNVEYSHLKVENGENSTMWIPSKNDLAVNLQSEFDKHMFGGGTTGQRYKRSRDCEVVLC